MNCGTFIRGADGFWFYEKYICFYFVADGQSPLKTFARLRRWKNVTGGDIRIFFAHVLVMGIMKRGNYAKYWSGCKITKLDFFGKYLSRNAYQMILSNFHCAPDYNNPQKGSPGHDPLHKIRPVITMCQKNFHLKYRPGKCLSFDEGSCGFRGRLNFLTYNKDKPAKWAIKIFEVTDAENAFVCGFDVYCGKNDTCCANNANVFDPECTKTTRTVVGLLDSVQLLDKGHFVYLDNWYNSWELNLELLSRYTYVSGTLRKNRRGNPKAVVKANLKKGEAVYRRNGNVLCIKWCQKKKCVTMMSTIHSAVSVEVNKRGRRNTKVTKPLVVHDYTQKMRGVDRNDQYMSYYSGVRRTVKWTTKLAIHLFSMCITNAYILYTKYGNSNEKLDHEEFILKIVQYLIDEGLKTRAWNNPPERTVCGEVRRLNCGDHFPELIPRKEGTKRKPSRPCFACNGSWDDMRMRRLPKRCSGIWCKVCKKVLCVTPCFETFHTNENYKEVLLEMRFGNNGMIGGEEGEN